ncbi:MAG: AsmA family protein [Gammaproteobacteria bacterium]|nr:AsmA family protein [Gammaproteobacteria bacterium]MBU6509210.1 AsmA family protein [Gammaproteobacteria bacterium]MDE1983397.1 AsmA family protein [Gammaproteobacteria bacterium]MDE2107801.1 AsmA family protein [Gammaproteobacteria bacterium]MDE2461362.1 AsmA family protein [Gammaproteobacteria bacterium]
MPAKPHLPERNPSQPHTGSPHRPWKIAGIVVVCIIAVIVILIIVLPFVINPNDFKPQIAKAVKDKTGRDLSIPGDIKLSIFPWLGAEIGPMALSNAPGFGNTPFASINETDVHVKFWPLLRGKIEVGNVKLDGLQLDLERDASGHNNWQDIVDHVKNGGSAPASGGGTSGNGLANLQMQGFSISHSGLMWRDAQKHQQYSFSNFHVDMGAFASGKPVHVATGFDFSGTNPQLGGHADFSGIIAADLVHKIYSSSNARLDVNASGDAVPGGQVQTQVTWQQAALNMEAGTLAVNSLAASAYGLKLQTDVEGRGLHEQPSFNGSLTLAPFAPRAALTALGHAAFANTRDPQALTRASGSLNFVSSGSAVTLQDLNFKLDDSTLTGTVSLKDFKSRALAFNLNVDQINADRYLPPQKAATPTQPREPTDINKISLPVRTLRGLNLDGQVHIGQFTLLNAHSSNLSLGVTAANGVVQINPVSAELYGGALKGSLRIDASSDTPVVTEDFTLTNVQAGGLVQDLFGVKRLSGTANLSMSTRALGPTVGEIRHTLNGRMSFAFKNGAVQGINIWYAIAQAEALVRHQPAPPPAANQTEFANLRGSGSIRNGVLDNRDLVANLPFLNLDGSGKLDLAENTLDYALKAHITGTPKLGAAADVSGLAGKTIPLRITGTLASPSVRPDIGGAVQSELEKKKQELRKKLENKLKGIIHVPAY